jgi:hypothetical protein
MPPGGTHAMLFDIAAQAKNNVDDVDAWETAGGWRTWRNGKNVSENAGVSFMSAKRDLSAVSAKSGSATFAQMPARIHGMSGGGGKDTPKMENLCRVLSPSTCAVENASPRRNANFTDKQLKSAGAILIIESSPHYAIFADRRDDPQETEAVLCKK